MKKIILGLFIIVLLYGCTKENGLGPSRFSDIALSGDTYTKTEENPFVQVSEQPVSTFSIDADGASYANVRRFIKQDNGDTYDKLRQNPPVIDLPDFDWSAFIEKLKEIIPDITTNPTLPNIGKALASIGKVLIKQMKKDDLLGIVTDIYHTKDFDFSRQHDYKGQLCKYKVQNKVSKV